MKDSAKIEIAKMRSLMERMDNTRETRDTMMLNESHLISEATNVNRRQVTRDEIYDVLNKMSDIADKTGKRPIFSFTYVKPVDFYKTKKNWRSDDVLDYKGKLHKGVTSTLAQYDKEGNEHWFDDITNYNNPSTTGKNPIKSIIVAQRYVINYLSPNQYNKKYGEYADALHNLRMRNGIGLSSDGMVGDARNQFHNDDQGNKVDQNGKIKRFFNVSKILRYNTTNYICDETGHIKGEIPGDLVSAMTKLPSETKPEKDVAAALQGPALEEYMKAKKELDATFKTGSFEDDKILCIVATCDGDSFYYINDAIASPIVKKSDVNVNSEELKQIAMNQLGQSFDEIQGFAN